MATPTSIEDVLTSARIQGSRGTYWVAVPQIAKKQALRLLSDMEDKEVKEDGDGFIISFKSSRPLKDNVVLKDFLYDADVYLPVEDTDDDVDVEGEEQSQAESDERKSVDEESSTEWLEMDVRAQDVLTGYCGLDRPPMKIPGATTVNVRFRVVQHVNGRDHEIGVWSFMGVPRNILAGFGGSRLYAELPDGVVYTRESVYQLLKGEGRPRADPPRQLTEDQKFVVQNYWIIKHGQIAKDKSLTIDNYQQAERLAQNLAIVPVEKREEWLHGFASFVKEVVRLHEQRGAPKPAREDRARRVNVPAPRSSHHADRKGKDKHQKAKHQGSSRRN